VQVLEVQSSKFKVQNSKFKNSERGEAKINRSIDPKSLFYL
jgi:hypothetical protein